MGLATMNLINRLWKKGIIPIKEKIEKKLGNTEISDLGDGTVTGAIAELNTGLSAAEKKIPAAVRVKGNAETAYRTGDVNLTPANIGLGNVGNYKAVSIVASQGLSDVEKVNARNNIGAGTSSFSGSYNDLSDRPSIPAAVRVKGNAEAAYHTGDVNLTPANIGALSLSGGKINGDILTDSVIQWFSGTGPLIGAARRFGDNGYFSFCPAGWETVEALKSQISIGYSNSSNPDQVGIWPRTDNLYDVGYAYNRWKQIYAANSAISTSDKRMKDKIRQLDESLTKRFVLGLNPVSYIMKDGESGRTHYGLISQEIEQLMEEIGMTSMDFAGFIKSPKTELVREELTVIEGEYIYGLRYEEFIAPVIKMEQILYDLYQEQDKKIQEQDKTIQELTVRLEAVEQRLDPV